MKDSKYAVFLCELFYACDDVSLCLPYEKLKVFDTKLEAEEYASWCDYPVYTHSSETYMGEPVDVVKVSLDYDLEDVDDE